MRRSRAEYCDDPVCLCVCTRVYLRNHNRPNFTECSTHVAVAVARFSSGGVLIRYELPVYG